MKRVGVAIVSFNTRDLLAACLESLTTCSLPFHVVVVDNASRDGSAALVRRRFPWVTLIDAGRNLGFAAATNLAIRTVRDLHPTLDYVLALNPDTVVGEGAIETLVAFLDAHPRVGIVAPRLLNPDGTVQTAAFRFPTLLMTVLDLFPPGEVLPGRLYNSWWHGRYPQEQSGAAPFPIDHPLGACMLVRCAVIDQIGMLDEEYFMYAEEVDWCYRARRAGWAIWQEPRARWCMSRRGDRSVSRPDAGSAVCESVALLSQALWRAHCRSPRGDHPRWHGAPDPRRLARLCEPDDWAR
jgi:N-acetylglucosaminyl-diphospho-decaprenol L-rhamnosyltransferase